MGAPLWILKVFDVKNLILGIPNSDPMIDIGLIFCCTCRVFMHGIVLFLLKFMFYIFSKLNASLTQVGDVEKVSSENKKIAESELACTYLKYIHPHNNILVIFIHGSFI